MRIWIQSVLALSLICLCHGKDPGKPTTTIRLSDSDFRLIRNVHFQGRDLFELAIQAGIYEKNGDGYLPGTERGAESVGGRTWHGSNGVGLVAYDPHMKRYAIYYLQDKAVPGHHLDIVYADDDLILFSYGYHKDIPALRPALEVYSVKRGSFAKLEAVSSSDGKFGRFDRRILAAEKPGNVGPSRGWNYTHLEEKEWVTLAENNLTRPQSVTVEGDVFRLWYNTDCEIEEFATSVCFLKEDLDRELDKIISNQAGDDNSE
tara:strand:+ start:1029 stop:1811 length:783 start_codon:yes stop_codon:yes gene_type:complete